MPRWRAQLWPWYEARCRAGSSVWKLCWTENRRPARPPKRQTITPPATADPVEIRGSRLVRLVRAKGGAKRPVSATLFTTCGSCQGRQGSTAPQPRQESEAAAGQGGIGGGRAFAGKRVLKSIRVSCRCKVQRRRGGCWAAGGAADDALIGGAGEAGAASHRASPSASPVNKCPKPLSTRSPVALLHSEPLRTALSVLCCRFCWPLHRPSVHEAHHGSIRLLLRLLRHPLALPAPRPPPDRDKEEALRQSWRPKQSISPPWAGPIRPASSPTCRPTGQ